MKLARSPKPGPAQRAQIQRKNAIVQIEQYNKLLRVIKRELEKEESGWAEMLDDGVNKTAPTVILFPTLTQGNRHNHLVVSHDGALVKGLVHGPRILIQKVSTTKASPGKHILLPLNKTAKYSTVQYLISLLELSV